MYAKTIFRLLAVVAITCTSRLWNINMNLVAFTHVFYLIFVSANSNYEPVCRSIFRRAVRRLLLIKTHKRNFAEYIFDALSKCDLSSQIVIALLNVHKWQVCVSGIRNSAVEFLFKATLISFLFRSRYCWFRGARGILFREIFRDCGRSLFISHAMKDVRESQKYFDFGQRLRFIAASTAINIYRFAPRLLRYGGTSYVTSRVREREATVHPAHISTS